MDLAVTVVQNGQLGSYRHIPVENHRERVSFGDLIREVGDAFVTTTTPGDLSSLKWVQSPLAVQRHDNTGQRRLEGGQHVYDISFGALNFRDVLLATATIPIESKFTYDESYMGFEFSGILTAVVSWA